MKRRTGGNRWLAPLGALALLAPAAFAQDPFGLDSRVPIGPYLNNVMPAQSGAFPFPAVLSATGAFVDLATLTPAPGLIPFAVNSPLWSDGAIKSRWMAVPNDGPPYTPDEQIGFVPVGEWGFPNGTVFVKHFELTVNEATGARKRLETRFLVRNAVGAVYGVTYKWRPDNSEADLLPAGLEEDIPITDASGAVRIQRYSYPSRADCLFCHNQQANYVLGPKTHQLNGSFTYPSTGRSDNQLRTLTHIEMLHPPPADPTFASYLRSVAVTSATEPVQTRMRSWIDANCSHCHRPGGFGPGYDGRFYTPLANQNLINIYVRFRDRTGSLLYQRDNALDQLKMPPLAKNVIHQNAMATLRQWIASPLEVLAIYLHQDSSHLVVRFNSHLDPETATVASNYLLDRGATVSEAVLSNEPDTVILSVDSLFADENYTLTVNDVRDTAPSANTIWPMSRFAFNARFAPPPNPARLANISGRVQVNADDNVAIGGFIVRGQPDKRVLIRGLGPSLAARGVQGTLADPVLELYDAAGTLLAANDNWNENANRQEIIDLGLPPLAAEESIIVLKLPANDLSTVYTAVLRGKGNTTGVGLLEIYDLDRGLGPDLANISTRGRVERDEGVMIGGFILSGTQSHRIIARALGPSLPVTGNLSDPTLELFDSNGVLLAANDNWRSHQEAEIIASQLPPPNDTEAAIIATLPAGANATAIVRGKNDTTGVALVEIYSLE